MNRNPVRIAHIVEEIYLVNEHVATRKYYQVFCGPLDTCGHQHKTKRSAQPCLKDKQKAYSKWRSDIAKRSWAARRKREMLEAKRVADHIDHVNQTMDHYRR